MGRGNKTQAALSFGAMIPIVGWGAVGMKIAKVNKHGNLADDIFTG